MPVALSEWRVRIGTFIHRIKEWVVREMREELLKQRIQRLRVLWERLKAKKDDSEGGSQDHKTKQDEVPLNSSDSSLVNPQGDCNAKPCTKGHQNSTPSSCAENVHHKPSSQKVTSQTDTSFISTPTHSQVSSKLCLPRPSLYSFFFLSFCFLFLFLLIFSFCVPLSPVFRLLFSVSLSFVMAFPFFVHLFSIPSICFPPSNILHFSRRERSFGKSHTSTATSLSYGSGHNQAICEQLPQQPNLQELMLLTAGDVELNPGPREGSIDSALQDGELVLLAREVLGNYYYDLSTGLGFSNTESKNVLTKHLLDIPKALIELFSRWKINQRDDTDCRTVLGEILKEAKMAALQTKLLEGKYLRSETETRVSTHGYSDEAMTEQQVTECANDLKSFYLERMCKIKPDPLDFNLIVEFEQLYTNLVLLRHDKGLTRETTHLDYKDLFTTKVGGVLPKRLFVEGEGGVGKTTLCSKIAWDWAHGCEEYERFRWVLVIPLRDVVKGQTVGDSMKNYLDKNNHVSPEQIEKYMESQPSKVLIVLDGFDEYDGDLSNNDISGISQGLSLDRFGDCTVLVTTRPWRAHEIKCNKPFALPCAFIRVEGFSDDNVNNFITKYFVKDEDAGKELARFIQSNDVIRENMGPFPIYITMLCILWKNIDSEQRDKIRKLKTFSQLFKIMVIFLGDHYLSKLEATNTLNEDNINKETGNTTFCLQQIGSVALSGLLDRKLVFKEEDFMLCRNEMITCCRIGVLSRETKTVPILKRSFNSPQAVSTNVFFPHKLFQEFVAALHLASLYDADHDEYVQSIGEVLAKNIQEFRYLLYFTAAQVKEVGLDIVKHLLQDIETDYTTGQRELEVAEEEEEEGGGEEEKKGAGEGGGKEEKEEKEGKEAEEGDEDGEEEDEEEEEEDDEKEEMDDDDEDGGEEDDEEEENDDWNHIQNFLADVTFEAYDTDTAKLVGQRIFAQKQALKIGQCMSAHTVSGYLFIMEQHSAETLELRRICGPTVSRDIANLLTSPTSLITLDLLKTELDDEFYSVILDDVSKRGESENNVQELHIDDPFVSGLCEFDLTIRGIYPRLKRLRFMTFETVSPKIVERFAHGSIEKLSIEHADVILKVNWEPVLLIGEPDSLGQLFSDSFSQLNSLFFVQLMIGNIRTTSIVQNLRKHQHFKAIHIISCFTDDQLDPLAEEINAENKMKVFFLHNEKETSLEILGTLTTDMLDALCHRTSVCHLTLVGVEADGLSFPDLRGKDVDSKIQSLVLHVSSLENQQSCCLGRFLSLLPHLTDLTISMCSVHDDFFKTFVDRASVSRIHTFNVFMLNLKNQQVGSCYLGRFLPLLPCLATLNLLASSFHDDFFRKIADYASLSQSPFFMGQKHIRLLEQWPGWKQHQELIQGGSSAAPRNHSEVEQSQNQGHSSGQSCLPYHQQEVTVPNDPLTGVQSESGPMNVSITYPHQVLEESIQSTSDQERATTSLNIHSSAYAQRTVSQGHSTEHSSFPGPQEPGQQFGLAGRSSSAVLQGQEEPVPLPSTSAFIHPPYTDSVYIESGYIDSVYHGGSIGMPMREEDNDPCMSSTMDPVLTSGITSLQRGHVDMDLIMGEDVPETCERTEGSVERRQTETDCKSLQAHRKRIHGGDKEETREESVEMRPRKRRDKTDRNPTSP